MTSPAPPRLATWLLEALSTDPHSEALIGDLNEQFGAGRSRQWYWRQAIGSLTLDLARTLRTHGLSFALAVLVGWASTWLWRLANTLAPRGLSDALDPARHSWTLDTLERFLTLHASQTLLTALVFVSVWIVTRIHRAHQRAVLVAFVLALTVPRLPGIAQLVIEAIVNSRLPSMLIPVIVKTCLQAVFTLAAGLWVIRKQRFAAMQPQTRFLTLLVPAIVITSCALYDAWKVGALHYPAAVRYPVDAAEIASGAYLALLMWRSRAAPARAAVETHRTGVPT